jgi:hypothetical protein
MPVLSRTSWMLGYFLREYSWISNVCYSNRPVVGLSTTYLFYRYDSYWSSYHYTPDRTISGSYGMEVESSADTRTINCIGART